MLAFIDGCFEHNFVTLMQRGPQNTPAEPVVEDPDTADHGDPDTADVRPGRQRCADCSALIWGGALQCDLCLVITRSPHGDPGTADVREIRNYLN